jgi:hypothetical protein
MQKGQDFWRRLGGLEKTFLILLVVYGIVAAIGKTPLAQSLLALSVVFTGLLSFSDSCGGCSPALSGDYGTG